MINISIPGREPLVLQHLICDYNGTLALDGKLLSELPKVMEKLSKELKIHVVTADTFGLATKELQDLPIKLEILPPGKQDEAKLAFIRELNAESCFCVGNGRNDKLMLAGAAVGVCLIQREGGSVATLAAADIICASIIDALELLLNPKRLIATLRV